MYKILVADDEKGYCDLLEKAINRMEGFHVVGKAYDGELAAKLVEQLHPDILITDINMPKLSGLDLLRQVQKIDSNIETLVVSGYSDFSYAKGAMALGVNDYLLKPFLPDELQEVLHKMGGQIEKRKALAENIHQLQKEADTRREAERQRLVLALAQGKETDLTATLARGEELGMQLRQEMYCVCIAHLRPAISNLAEIIRDGYFPASVMVYGAPLQPNLVAFLLCGAAGSEQEFYRMLVTAFKRVSHSLATYYSTNLWCALGNIYHDVSGVAESYREAFSVWQSKLEEDESVVCYGTAISQGSAPELRRPLELENRLLRLILSAETDKALDCLRQIITYYHELCLYNTEFVSISLVKLVFAISEARNKSEHSHQDEDSMALDYLKHHFTRGGLQDAAAVLERYVRSACQSFRSTQLEHTDKLVIALKELIEQKLSDEHFSLESAASQMYFSANYIRQLFKQKTGESFMEYLIRRRMETARSLLEDTDLQIQRIADQTGYSNSRYFASCFKKYYGCTPTECRARALANHKQKEDP